MGNDADRSCLGDNKHMVVVDVEFVEDERMCCGELSDECAVLKRR